TFAHDKTISGPGSVGLRSIGTGVTYDNFDAAVQGTTTSLPYPATGSENFDTAGPRNQLGDNWQGHVGNFTVDGVTKTAVTQSPVAVSTLYGVSQQDVVVQADINVTQVGQYAGLVGRYSGPNDNNMYWGAIGYTSTGLFAVIFYNDGTPWGAALSRVPVSTG